MDHITLFETIGLPCNIAAEVKGFEPSAYMSKKEAKRVGRVSQFAIAAAKMAIADAKIEIVPDNARHIGICFAAAMGKPEVFETDYNPYTLRGAQAIHPTTFFRSLAPCRLESRGDGGWQCRSVRHTGHGMYIRARCRAVGFLPDSTAPSAYDGRWEC